MDAFLVGDPPSKENLAKEKDTSSIILESSITSSKVNAMSAVSFDEDAPVEIEAEEEAIEASFVGEDADAEVEDAETSINEVVPSGSEQAPIVAVVHKASVDQRLVSLLDYECLFCTLIKLRQLMFSTGHKP